MTGKWQQASRSFHGQGWKARLVSRHGEKSLDLTGHLLMFPHFLPANCIDVYILAPSLAQVQPFLSPRDTHQP